MLIIAQKEDGYWHCNEHNTDFPSVDGLLTHFEEKHRLDLEDITITGGIACLDAEPSTEDDELDFPA